MAKVPDRAGWRASTLLSAALFGVAASSATASDLPEIVLFNAKVWTGNDAGPLAEAVRVRGDRVAQVGSTAEVLAGSGPGVRKLDLGGALVLPGFIDAHTHFENAADWFFNLSLYGASAEADVVRAVAEAAGRVPPGLWITGGDIGAYAAWDAERAGWPVPPPVGIGRRAVDAISPAHPVLLKRRDHSYFANSKALALARIDDLTPDPRGGRFGRDPKTGALDGMLYGRAAERLVHLVPPPTLERKLIGARAALRDLAKNGITTIHDVARLDAATQKQLLHTHVERSHSNVALFTELRRRGELTVRVYPLLTLRTWEALAPLGVTAGAGDEWIRYGGLKAFVDGSYMREPFASNPPFRGGFTFRVLDEKTMRDDIVGADRAGWDSAVHVLGDKAHELLLDWYEEAIAQNPPRDRRLRLIHAWYPAAEDVRRAGRLRLFADITPQHLVDEIDALESTLGPDRAAAAFPWRSLADAGVAINIVSDWPGGYNEQIPTPLSPLENIFMAVTRRGVHPGARAWRPEQALSVEEAVRAYTVNPARASREEHLKGSLREGMLADVVVLSKDIFTVPVAEIPSAEVLYTIVGGRVVYEKKAGSLP